MNSYGKTASALEAERAFPMDRGAGRLVRLWNRIFRPGARRAQKDPRAVPRIGVALSSGGAKSLAHVGVIQVLEENNIPVHAVAGASMGAYVGALWASGCDGKKLEALAAEVEDRTVLKKLADPAPPFIKGFLKGERAKAHLGKTLGNTAFSGLGKRLLVVASDLDSYERVVFRSGPVLDAVHASCAIPGVVVPVLVGERRCVDGGVAEPVPVSALRKFGDVDLVIAVSTLPDFDELRERRECEETEIEREVATGLWSRVTQSISGALSLAAEGNTLDTLRRSVRIAQIRIAHDACRRADLAIHPSIHGNTRWHDYHQFREFIQAGRNAAEAQLAAIHAMIRGFTPGKRERKDHEGQLRAMVG